MTSFVIIKNQKSISAMNKLVLKDQLKFEHLHFWGKINGKFFMKEFSG